MYEQRNEPKIDLEISFKTKTRLNEEISSGHRNLELDNVTEMKPSKLH